MASKYLDKLSGKRVLVFGGTSGIGRAVADAASLAFGATVAIAGSSQDRLNDTAQKLQQLGAKNVEKHLIDLSNTAELQRALPELLEKASHNGAKPFDHIVWTAGDKPAIFQSLDNIGLAEIHQGMAVRAIAPALLCAAIMKSQYKYLKKAASSSITVTGGSGTPFAILRMVGSGLDGLVQGLAVEMAPIRVNVVHPGLTATERMASLPPPALEGARKATLTARIAEVDDVAEAYLFAMKNYSITGQSLVTDSGKTISR